MKSFAISEALCHYQYLNEHGSYFIVELIMFGEEMWTDLIFGCTQTSEKGQINSAFWVVI